MCETRPIYHHGTVDDDETNRMLLAAGSGDEVEFARFFDATAPQLTALFTSLQWSKQRIERVIEHAYASAWRLAPLFTPVRRFAMLWLFVIACSTAATLA